MTKHMRKAFKRDLFRHVQLFIWHLRSQKTKIWAARSQKTPQQIVLKCMSRMIVKKLRSTKYFDVLVLVTPNRNTLHVIETTGGRLERIKLDTHFNTSVMHFTTIILFFAFLCTHLLSFFNDLPQSRRPSSSEESKWDSASEDCFESD